MAVRDLVGALGAVLWFDFDTLATLIRIQLAAGRPTSPTRQFGFWSLTPLTSSECEACLPLSRVGVRGVWERGSGGEGAQNIHKPRFEPRRATRQRTACTLKSLSPVLT